MHDPDQPEHSHDAARRCAICEGRFGLIRYYICGTALCSKKCAVRFKSRRAAYQKWLWQGHSPQHEGREIRCEERLS